MGMEQDDWDAGRGWAGRYEAGQSYRAIHRTLLGFYILDQVRRLNNGQAPAPLDSAYHATFKQIDDLDGHCANKSSYASANPWGFSDDVNLYWKFYYELSPIERAGTLYHEARHNKRQSCNGWPESALVCPHLLCGSDTCDEKLSSSAPYAKQFRFLRTAIDEGIRDVNSGHSPAALSAILRFIVSPEHVHKVALKAASILRYKFKTAHNPLSFGISEELDDYNGANANVAPPSVDSSECGATFVGLGPAAMQSCIAHWKASGFAIDLITAVERNNNPSYSGTVTLGSWIDPALALESLDFSAFVASMDAAGFEPTGLSVLSSPFYTEMGGSGGAPVQPRFTASFRPKTASTNVVLVDLDRADFDLLDAYYPRAAGWQFADLVHYVNVQDERKYAVWMQHNPSNPFIVGERFHLPTARDVWIEARQKGSPARLRPSYVSNGLRVHDPKLQYWGVWASGNGTISKHMLHVPEADLAKTIALNSLRRGLKPVSIHAYWSRGGHRVLYSISWTRECERLVCPDDYDDWVLNIPPGAAPNFALCERNADAVCPLLSSVPFPPTSYTVDYYMDGTDACSTFYPETGGWLTAPLSCRAPSGTWDTRLVTVPGEDSCVEWTRAICRRPWPPPK